MPLEVNLDPQTIILTIRENQINSLGPIIVINLHIQHTVRRRLKTDAILRTDLIGFDIPTQKPMCPSIKPPP